MYVSNAIDKWINFFLKKKLMQNLDNFWHQIYLYIYCYLEVAMLTKKINEKIRTPKKCGEYKLHLFFLLKWPAVQKLQHDALFQQLNFSTLF